jgi:hypothetical protein
MQVIFGATYILDLILVHLGERHAKNAMGLPNARDDGLWISLPSKRWMPSNSRLRP